MGFSALLEKQKLVSLENIRASMTKRVPWPCHCSTRGNDARSPQSAGHSRTNVRMAEHEGVGKKTDSGPGWEQRNRIGDGATTCGARCQGHRGRSRRGSPES